MAKIVADYFKIICIPWAFRKGIAKYFRYNENILWVPRSGGYFRAMLPLAARSE